MARRPAQRIRALKFGPKTKIASAICGAFFTGGLWFVSTGADIGSMFSGSQAETKTAAPPPTTPPTSTDILGCTTKNRSELLDLIRKHLATPEQVAELARSIGCEQAAKQINTSTILLQSDIEYYQKAISFYARNPELLKYVQYYATSPWDELREAFANAVERDFDDRSMSALGTAEYRLTGQRLVTEDFQTMLHPEPPRRRTEGTESAGQPRTTSER